MKNLLTILSLILLPFTAHAAFAVGWNATSTDAGVISPNPVNGSISAIKVPYIVATSTTATSTFAGAVGIGTSSPYAEFSVGGTLNSFSPNFVVQGFGGTDMKWIPFIGELDVPNLSASGISVTTLTPGSIHDSCGDVAVIDINVEQLNDDPDCGDPVLSLDWKNRILYGSDGTTAVLNWNNNKAVIPYASTTMVTATIASSTDIYDSGLGSAAGVIVGADSKGKLISTTTIQATLLRGTVSVGNGGTGRTSFTANQVLVGNGNSPIGMSINTPADGNTLRYYTIDGVPSWGTLDLSSSNAVANVLPIANGGTNSSTIGASSTVALSNGTKLNYMGTSTLGLQSPISLTTTGSSGAATFSANVLNIPQYTGTPYPFPVATNSTSTLTGFNGGITAYATSTIGAGGTATGLTINGGATTTGTTYLNGKETLNNTGIATTTVLAVASTSPSGSSRTTLAVDSNGHLSVGFDQKGANTYVDNTEADVLTVNFQSFNPGTGSNTIFSLKNRANTRVFCISDQGTMVVDNASATCTYPNSLNTAVIYGQAVQIGTDTGGGAGLILKDRSGTGLFFEPYVLSDNYGVYNSNLGQNAFTVLGANSDMGIGTTTPDSTLDVYGTVRLEGSSAIVTASISGAIVGLGCDSADTSGLSGLASTTAFITTPQTYPGDGLNWFTYALNSTTIRTKVCSDVTVTPTASTYNVKIIR